jgi:anaerobic selenocysteine-containing dehydrogenase
MAQEITGIHADSIRQVARKFASAKPSMIYAGYRASKYLHGDLLQRALFLLLCITGNTGKEGGGLTITNLAKDDAVFPFALSNPAAAFRVATLSRWDYVHADMKELNEDAFGKELADEMDKYFQESVEKGWFPDYSKVPWKMGMFQEPMQQPGVHREKDGGKPLSVSWKPLSALQQIWEQLPCILITFSQLPITMSGMIFT